MGSARVNHFAAKGDWSFLFGGQPIHRERESVGGVRCFRRVVKREFVERNCRCGLLASVEIKVVRGSHCIVCGRREAAGINAEILTDVIVDRRAYVADYYKNGVVIGSESLHEKQPGGVREVGHHGGAAVRYGVSVAVHDLAQWEGTPAAEQVDYGGGSDFQCAGLRGYNAAVGVGQPIGSGSEGDLEVESQIINVRARLRDGCR